MRAFTVLFVNDAKSCGRRLKWKLPVPQNFHLDHYAIGLYFIFLFVVLILHVQTLIRDYIGKERLKMTREVAGHYLALVGTFYAVLLGLVVFLCHVEISGCLFIWRWDYWRRYWSQWVYILFYYLALHFLATRGYRISRVGLFRWRWIPISRTESVCGNWSVIEASVDRHIRSRICIKI